jgi:hypothetical protein
MENNHMFVWGKKKARGKAEQLHSPSPFSPLV